MLDSGEGCARGETVEGIGSEMDNPRRELLRLRILAGPVGLVDDGEGVEAGGDGGRLIVAVADSDRTCWPVMVADSGRIQPT